MEVMGTPNVLNYGWFHVFMKIMVNEHISPHNDEETLPIINKPKHPKKGEYKEQNGMTHVQEDERTT